MTQSIDDMNYKEAYEPKEGKMSRIIKFRVWLPKLKHMVNVYEMVFTNKGISVRLKGFHYEHYRTYKHGEFILMQFTGLLDKNGKEIYCLDKIKNPSDGEIATVEWDERGACFIAWFLKGTKSMYYHNGFNFIKDEVVGNEYEN